MSENNSQDLKDEKDNWLPNETGKTVIESISSGQDRNRIASVDMIQVDWDGPNDPKYPRNWSLTRKTCIVLIVWINAFTLEWAASADSQAGQEIAREFNTSLTMESLSPALYVMGIATGALFAGPITETVGRRPIYVYSRIGHVMAVLGSCLAFNINEQLMCRFSAGLGASTIIAIHATSLADMFGEHERSLVLPFVALASFTGTTLAPVVGGWIGQSSTISWRWTDWIALIQSVIVLIITAFFMPETFAPIILKKKAEHMRKTTGNDKYFAEIELQKSLRARLGAKFRRTWLMTTREYIVILLGLWLVVVFAIIFGFLEGFKVIFQGTYGFSQGKIGTCFAAIALGVTLNICLSPVFYYSHKHMITRWRSKNGEDNPTPPELRLVPAFAPAVTFPLAIFWLGWSNYSSISVWSSIGAAALCGFSWAGIFIPVYQYILDVYGIYAGTALSGIACFRFYAAGGMTVASESLYRSLGVHGIMTLLGSLSGVLALAPVIFFVWGSRIRALSRFANTELCENKVAGDSKSRQESCAA